MIPQKNTWNLKILVRKEKEKIYKHGLLGDLPNCHQPSIVQKN
jgi:hypothetical protein